MSVTRHPTPASVDIWAQVTEELHQRQCSCKAQRLSGPSESRLWPPRSASLSPLPQRGDQLQARGQQKPETREKRTATHQARGAQWTHGHPRGLQHARTDLEAQSIPLLPRPSGCPSPRQAERPRAGPAHPSGPTEPTHQARRQKGSPTCPAGAGSREACGSSATGPGR